MKKSTKKKFTTKNIRIDIQKTLKGNETIFAISFGFIVAATIILWWNILSSTPNNIHAAPNEIQKEKPDTDRQYQAPGRAISVQEKTKSTTEKGINL